MAHVQFQTLFPLESLNGAECFNPHVHGDSAYWQPLWERLARNWLDRERGPLVGESWTREPPEVDRWAVPYEGEGELWGETIPFGLATAKRIGAWALRVLGVDLARHPREYSIAAAGVYGYRRSWQTVDVWPPAGAARAPMQEATWAGIHRLVRRGRVERRIWEIDLGSAYPVALASLGGVPASARDDAWVPTLDPWKASRFALFRVRWRVGGAYGLGWLPTASPDSAFAVYPYQGEAWVTRDDVVNALQFFGSRAVDVLDGLDYVGRVETGIADMMGDLTRRRLRAKAKGERALADRLKALSVSTIGKFVAKRRIPVFRNKASGELEPLPYAAYAAYRAGGELPYRTHELAALLYRPVRHTFCPTIPCYTWARGRRHLGDLLRSLDAEVLSMSVDGVIVASEKQPEPRTELPHTVRRLGDHFVGLATGYWGVWDGGERAAIRHMGERDPREAWRVLERAAPNDFRLARRRARAGEQKHGANRELRLYQQALELRKSGELDRYFQQARYMARVGS